MKKLLIVTVFTLLCFLFCSYTYGQNTAKETIHSTSNYNLPPGAVLGMKGVKEKDLSFKLNSNDFENNELAEDFLRKFSSEEINLMNVEKGKDYYYYNEANEYFLSLSDKVRKIYNYEELWFIYMFDQSLKNKLITIK